MLDKRIYKYDGRLFQFRDGGDILEDMQLKEEDER